MKKLKYSVTVFTLCEGTNYRGEWIRRWRKMRKYRYYTKADAIRAVKYFSKEKDEKATLKKEV